jgi:hypothetical protein
MVYYNLLTSNVSINYPQNLAADDLLSGGETNEKIQIFIN